ncbi:MAG: hypothetical protein PHU89_01800 [Bacilli bacterium]|nr:hypothetical protein [Bacilli bacterium]
MAVIEIVVIIVCVAIVGGVFGTWVYKKTKGLPTGDCESCGLIANKKKILKQYRKKYKKTAK